MNDRLPTPTDAKLMRELAQHFGGGSPPVQPYANRHSAGQPEFDEPVTEYQPMKDWGHVAGEPEPGLPNEPVTEQQPADPPEPPSQERVPDISPTTEPSDQLADVPSELNANSGTGPEMLADPPDSMKNWEDPETGMIYPEGDPNRKKPKGYIKQEPVKPPLSPDGYSPSPMDVPKNPFETGDPRNLVRREYGQEPESLPTNKEILEQRLPVRESLGLPKGDTEGRVPNHNGEFGDEGNWRDADRNPLPGEENIHPDIKTWAESRQARGLPGITQLRRAYLAQMPNDRGNKTFDEWLAEQGFDPNNDLGYRGSKAVLDRLAPVAGRGALDDKTVTEKHWVVPMKDEITTERPWTEQEKQDRLRNQGILPYQLDRNEDRIDQMINTYVGRYGVNGSLIGQVGMGAPRKVFEDVANNAALEAAQNGEDPILAAGRALHKLTDPMFQDAENLRQGNVFQAREDRHTAEQMGVPLGLAKWQRLFRNARTPEERQRVLDAYTAQFPGAMNEQVLTRIAGESAVAAAAAGNQQQMPEKDGDDETFKAPQLAAARAGFDASGEQYDTNPIRYGDDGSPMAPGPDGRNLDSLSSQDYNNILHGIRGNVATLSVWRESQGLDEVPTDPWNSTQAQQARLFIDNHQVLFHEVANAMRSGDFSLSTLPPNYLKFVQEIARMSFGDDQAVMPDLNDPQGRMDAAKMLAQIFDGIIPTEVSGGWFGKYRGGDDEAVTSLLETLLGPASLPIDEDDVPKSAPSQDNPYTPPTGGSHYNPTPHQGQ